jgi:hypothetical protein
MPSAAKVIAEKIYEKKMSSNGLVSWGSASSLLKQGRDPYPKLSMRIINSYIMKFEKEKHGGTPLQHMSNQIYQMKLF